MDNLLYYFLKNIDTFLNLNGKEFLFEVINYEQLSSQTLKLFQKLFLHYQNQNTEKFIKNKYYHFLPKSILQARTLTNEQISNLTNLLLSLSFEDLTSFQDKESNQQIIISHYQPISACLLKLVSSFSKISFNLIRQPSNFRTILFQIIQNVQPYCSSISSLKTFHFISFQNQMNSKLLLEYFDIIRKGNTPRFLQFMRESGYGGIF
ncbi:hypothetical protein M0811_11631 [Anaeramoeba ignava]|uniref:Uncharacterized protein n=1 Tax=Anaeramoeba ignava TaxID=1746090 RepID=A0A9Q0LDC8_ANAIG|nr:hypothetical protein M0811_11631 [Anaeramoeba ignava]